jgi:bifunctional non-homologous end joining protein LigD
VSEREDPEFAATPASVGGSMSLPPPSWRPQLAVQATAPPAGDGWLHEVKFDGYRTLAFGNRGQVRLVTRRGLDWTHRYGPLANVLAGLPCDTAILDGEVAVPGDDGVTSLDYLQRALLEGRTDQLAYYAFDLPYLNGEDLSPRPLAERQAALRDLLNVGPGGPTALRYSAPSRDGEALFDWACRTGAEGIVSKRADAPYVQARSASWVKVKREETNPFAVVGFLTNQPRCVSSLILAEARENGLTYSCRSSVGAQGRDLYGSLEAIQRATSPIAVPPIKGACWVEPIRTASIRFHGRNARQTPRAPVLVRLT